MQPPWLVHADIPWGSLGWRMGQGEQYWQQWSPWYDALQPQQRADYHHTYPEPEEWTGFYAVRAAHQAGHDLGGENIRQLMLQALQECARVSHSWRENCQYQLAFFQISVAAVESGLVD